MNWLWTIQITCPTNTAIDRSPTIVGLPLTIHPLLWPYHYGQSQTHTCTRMQLTPKQSFLKKMCCPGLDLNLQHSFPDKYSTTWATNCKAAQPYVCIKWTLLPWLADYVLQCERIFAAKSCIRTICTLSALHVISYNSATSITAALLRTVWGEDGWREGEGLYITS